MTDFTRTFTLTRTRTARDAIVDAAGWTGVWPLRRTLSFHIGVNCDAIAVEGDRLYVRRRGRTIAVAALPAPRTGWRSRWAALLFPRHAGNQLHSRPSGAPATGLQWEDLLRPRDRNRR